MLRNPNFRFWPRAPVQLWCCKQSLRRRVELPMAGFGFNCRIRALGQKPPVRVVPTKQSFIFVR
jgi:hypothetical protein